MTAGPRACHIHVWGPADACQVLLDLGLIASYHDVRGGLRGPPVGLDHFIGFDWEPEQLHRTAAAIRIARSVATFPWMSAEATLHQAAYLAQSICAALGADANSAIDTSEGLLRWMPGSHRALLHPGASTEAKRWPIQQFRGLAVWLAGRGYEVTWLEAPGESHASHGRVATVPFCILPSILKDADLFVGNDSAVTHLAALLGLPTLALFGASQQRVWRPVGPRASYIQTCPVMLRHAWRHDFHWGHDCFAGLSLPLVQTTILAMEETHDFAP